MDTNTGEIREFSDGVIPKGSWVEWTIGETVKCKDCTFRVNEINIAENTILLKGIVDTQVK